MVIKKNVFFFIGLFFLSSILLSSCVLASESFLISEINYNPLGSSLDEYVEFTIRDDSGSDLNSSGWYITTFDEGINFTLPDMIDLGEFDYVSIRADSGID